MVLSFENVWFAVRSWRDDAANAVGQEDGHRNYEAAGTVAASSPHGVVGRDYPKNPSIEIAVSYHVGDILRSFWGIKFWPILDLAKHDDFAEFGVPHSVMRSNWSRDREAKLHLLEIHADQ